MVDEMREWFEQLKKLTIKLTNLFIQFILQLQLTQTNNTIPALLYIIQVDEQQNSQREWLRNSSAIAQTQRNISATLAQIVAPNTIAAKIAAQMVEF